MWELDHKEGLVLKNWCFGIVLEKTLESPLDSKEIQPVNHKGNQPRIFTGRTDANAKTPILWLSDGRVDSLENTLMLAKTESKRRRGWQRMRGLDSTTDPMDMNLSKLWEMGKDREAWRAPGHGFGKIYWVKTNSSEYATTLVKRRHPQVCFV